MGFVLVNGDAYLKLHVASQTFELTSLLVPKGRKVPLGKVTASSRYCRSSRCGGAAR